MDGRIALIGFGNEIWKQAKGQKMTAARQIDDIDRD